LTPPSGGHVAKDIGNVFSRLANPSKYTGIHRRKKHLPESPGSSVASVAPASSNDDNKPNAGASSRSGRRVRSHSIDRSDSVASGDVETCQVRDHRDKRIENDANARRRTSDSSRPKSAVERDKDLQQQKSPDDHDRKLLLFGMRPMYWLNQSFRDIFTSKNKSGKRDKFSQ
jgi:hypothetical protein